MTKKTSRSASRDGLATELRSYLSGTSSLDTLTTALTCYSPTIPPSQDDRMVSSLLLKLVQEELGHVGNKDTHALILQVLSLAMQLELDFQLLRPNFKSALGLQLFIQKCAVCVMDQNDFHSASELFSLIISSFPSHSLRPKNEENEENGHLRNKTRSENGKESKSASVMVFALYNQARCLVEEGHFSSVIKSTGESILPWMKRLEQLDVAKYLAFRKSLEALLFYHAPGILEKQRKDHATAFEFRKRACLLFVQLEIGERTGNVELDQRKRRGKEAKASDSGVGGNGDQDMNKENRRNMGVALEDEEREQKRRRSMDKVVRNAIAACAQLNRATGKARESLQETVGLYKELLAMLAKAHKTSGKEDVLSPCSVEALVLCVDHFVQDLEALEQVEVAVKVLTSFLQKPWLQHASIPRALLLVDLVLLECRAAQGKKAGISLPTWDKVIMAALEDTDQEHWYMTALEEALEACLAKGEGEEEEEEEEEEKDGEQAVFNRLARTSEKLCILLTKALPSTPKKAAKQPQKHTIHTVRTLDMVCKLIVNGELFNLTPPAAVSFGWCAIAEVLALRHVNSTTRPSDAEFSLEDMVRPLEAALETSFQSDSFEAVQVSCYNVGARLYNQGALDGAERALSLALSKPSVLFSEGKCKVLASCQMRQEKFIQARSTYVLWVCYLLDQCVLAMQSQPPCDLDKLLPDLLSATSGFCNVNLQVSRSSRHAFETLCDAIEQEVPQVLHEPGFVQSILPILVRFEVDEYTKLCCSHHGAADLLHKLQDSCLAKAKQLASSPLRFDIELARALWFRAFHSLFCASCSEAPEENEEEEIWVRQLERAKQLCSMSFESLAVEDEGESEDDQVYLSALCFQWLGITLTSLERGFFARFLNKEHDFHVDVDGQIAEQIAEEEERANNIHGPLQRALDEWTKILLDRHSTLGAFRAFALNELDFLAHWAEHTGRHDICSRATELLVGAVESKQEKNEDESWKLLLRLAELNESKLGKTETVASLCNNIDHAPEPFQLLFKARFFAYNFLPVRRITSETLQESQGVSLSELYKFLSTLERDVAARLETPSQSDEEQEEEEKSEELAANLLDLLSRLQDAQGNKPLEALESAQSALKFRSSTSSKITTKSSFSGTGVEWDHVHSLASSIAQVGKIYQSMGNPRMCKYYLEQGAQLASMVGSVSIANTFAFLRFPLTLKLGDIAGAESLLKSIVHEPGARHALEVMFCRVELCLSRNEIAQAQKDLGAAQKLCMILAQESNATLGRQLDANINKVAMQQCSNMKKQKKRGTRSTDTDVIVGGEEEEQDVVANSFRSPVFLFESMLRLAQLRLRLAQANCAPDKLAKDVESLFSEILRESSASPVFVSFQFEALLEQARYLSRHGSFQDALKYLDIAHKLSLHSGDPVSSRRLLRCYAMSRLLLPDTTGSDHVGIAMSLQASFALALSVERMRLTNLGNEEEKEDPLSRLHQLHTLSLPEQESILSEHVTKHLPSNWSVVAIAELEDFPYAFALSRVSSSPECSLAIVVTTDPVRVESRVAEFLSIIRATEETTQGVTTSSTAEWGRKEKRQWWEQRKDLDERLEQFLLAMEQDWLKGYEFAFALPVQQQQKCGEKNLEKAKACFEALRRVAGGKPNVTWHVFRQWYLYYSERAHQLCGEELERELSYSVARVFGVGASECKDLCECIKAALFESASGGVVGSNAEERNEVAVPLEDIDKMKVVELRACLTKLCLPSKGLKKDLIARLKAAIEGSQSFKEDNETKGNEESFGMEKQGHLVLVLSEKLQQIPFESMPFFSARSVSRMPSLSFVLEHLARNKTRQKLDVKNGAFVVDPKGDLGSTRETFQAYFSKLSNGKTEKTSSSSQHVNWTGMNGPCKKADLVSFFSKSLRERDVVLYCGHGTGEDLVSREEVAGLTKCSATLLMGCSSGKLKQQGIFEPGGVVMAYVLSGAPVVGNLWDVTDKDIDRLTCALLDQWVVEGTLSLCGALQASRKVCKLKTLVGAAPVCIGLPV